MTNPSDFNKYVGWKTFIDASAVSHAFNQIEHVADFIVNGQSMSLNYGQVAMAADSCGADPKTNMFKAALNAWEGGLKAQFESQKKAYLERIAVPVEEPAIIRLYVPPEEFEQPVESLDLVA